MGTSNESVFAREPDLTTSPVKAQKLNERLHVYQLYVTPRV